MEKQEQIKRNQLEELRKQIVDQMENGLYESLATGNDQIRRIDEAIADIDEGEAWDAMCEAHNDHPNLEHYNDNF